MTGPKLLARHLQDAGVSQAEFARLTGVPHSSISFFLSGSRRPGVATAAAIEKASGGAVPIESWAKPLKGKPARPSKAA